MADMRVMPWVGGVLGEHTFPGSASWRRTFAADVHRLLVTHPRLAGIHLNVEPLPTGNAAYLTLLEEVRQTLPPGKVLSVAAYPPPTVWQPAPEVHWDQAYYRQVAGCADQLVVMMYDTGLPLGKVYVSLLAGWTGDVLTWVPEGEVLLGLPAYEDLALYHWPWVESLGKGLRGVHAGLGQLDGLPTSYQGIAIYSQWTMTEREWKLLEEGFSR
jgi:spore germination protein YaaH